MWAVMLGVLLVLAAAASSHAATRSHAHDGATAARLPAGARVHHVGVITP
jgi:acid phosphatase class B